MPWQEHVLAVATEYDPATGRPFYRYVWITVPRQSGKTTLILVLLLVRALTWGSAQRIIYTAQSGQDARDKLIEDWKPVLQASPAMWGTPNTPHPAAAALVAKVREQNGTEGVDFVNGSTLRTIASNKSSGHGKTLHLGFVDEAFHDRDFRREQAMIPAQNTVADAQLVGVSTMGDADSVLLNTRVAQGRKAVADDTDRGFAYFEWSAPPDADLFDVDVWRRCMPALGHTTDEETIRASIETMAANVDEGPDEARRAYLNIATAGHRTVFPPDAWGLVARMDVQPSGLLTLAADMHPDRTAAAIVIADDDHALELVDHRAGVGWVEDRLVELAKALEAPVVIDHGGPAGNLCDALENRGVTVIRAGTRDLTQACGAFYDAVIDRTLEIRDHPDAAEAVTKARKRIVSDAWAWARKVGDHDASPLVAMSLALWGTAHRPTTTRPAVMTVGADEEDIATRKERLRRELAAARKRVGGQ